MQNRMINSVLFLAGGAAAGVAAMYLLDPNAGERRRARIASAAQEAVHHASDAVHHVGDMVQHAGESVQEAAISAGEKIGGYASRARRASRAAGQAAIAAAPTAAQIGAAGIGAASGMRQLVDSYHDSAQYLADRVDQLRHSLDPHTASHLANLAHAGQTLLAPVVRGARSTLSSAQSALNSARSTLGRVTAPSSAARTVAKTSLFLIPITAGGVVCIAAGAGAMYFLDPDRGHDRRAGVCDGVADIVHKVGKFTHRRGQNVRNNVQGLARQIGIAPQQRAPSSDYVSGEQLLLRVRGEISRTAGNPSAIQVMTDTFGTVTLNGEIFDSEHDRVVAAIRQLPGVRELVDRLQIQATPGATPNPATT